MSCEHEGIDTLCAAIDRMISEDAAYSKSAIHMRIQVSAPRTFYAINVDFRLTRKR